MAETATERSSRRAAARANEGTAGRSASDINSDVTDRIRANPKYHELKRKRNSFGWTLTLCMFVVYYGYIALIAFNKEFLSQPIGAGVTTIGVPIGLGVIIFTVLITGLYVRRANSEFDALTREILAKEAA
jgi:uncharacterized membrane protein (DUF485 family)